MMAWIWSAMDLTAKIALGSLFWAIAICAIVAVIGLVAFGIQKIMEG